MEIAASNIVRSVAGRDQGKLFIVLAVEGEYLLLADGKSRKVESPKRKKRRHVLFVAADENRLSEKIRGFLFHSAFIDDSHGIHRIPPEEQIIHHIPFQALIQLLVDHGWTWLTAVCTMLFSLMHWPCSTTLLTIHKETGSWKWTGAAVLIPTICGVLSCAAVRQGAALLGVTC